MMCVEFSVRARNWKQSQQISIGERKIIYHTGEDYAVINKKQQIYRYQHGQREMDQVRNSGRINKKN